jgi:hypothetical protein
MNCERCEAQARYAAAVRAVDDDVPEEEAWRRARELGEAAGRGEQDVEWSGREEQVSWTRVERWDEKSR